MSPPPDLIVKVQLPGSAGTVAPLLAELLATGIHQGIHLRLEPAGAQGYRFTGPGGFLSRLPGHALLQVKDSVKGVAQVRVEVWFPGLRRRCLMWAVLAGALLATAGALAWGWLISVSIPVSVASAFVVDQVCWRSWRRRKSHSIQALLQNSVGPSA